MGGSRAAGVRRKPVDGPAAVAVASLDNVECIKKYDRREKSLERDRTLFQLFNARGRIAR